MSSAITAALPAYIEDEASLDEVMSRPSPALVEDLTALEGDIMILGVAGKMGPTLARLARRASDEAGVSRRVIGVSRFSQPGTRQQLESWGVETIACDLLDREALASLPQARNIVFMAGRKFGSTGAEATTWAMNAYLPGLVAERFPDSRFVVFSSGNVYPLVPVISGGAVEEDLTAPVGEYAQSVLARERLFEYFSRERGIPVTLIRLNYAIDLRYGVLFDIGAKVHAGEPVDVTMGHANVIWQGDANSYVLRAFGLCSSPPAVLNVTGPEIVSVRRVAQRFGELLGREPVIQGQESPTAFLNNAGRCFSLFGYPTVPLDTMIRWIARWLELGGSSLGKPTHFETRDGRF
ncbi:MAG: NAD(P)-dependent oxidoreductase [Anaerolineae bacterium]|nr:NAD(P)-dependent oxidoreductase [Anaerolineae bacterium]